jgi:hypothetical protein
MSAAKCHSNNSGSAASKPMPNVTSPKVTASTMSIQKPRSSAVETKTPAWPDKRKRDLS